MEITGPMRDSIMKQYIPGPGNYSAKSSLENGHITLKSRMPDLSHQHKKMFPGPGTYES